jgi:hypothetical protein
MYDDILKKNGSLDWDFEQYEKKPYCPVCGSEYLTIIREQLLSDRLEKDIRCTMCGTEWRETWNKDIELSLREVSICTGYYVTFYQRLFFGFCWEPVRTFRQAVRLSAIQQ